MSDKIAFPFVNGRYRFTMPDGYEPIVNFWAWGGGGGAGGDSPSAFGGFGSSGVFVSGAFIANPGDRIEIVPGGGGVGGDTQLKNLKLGSVTVGGTPGLSNPGGPGGAFGKVSVGDLVPTNPEYSNYLPPSYTTLWGATGLMPYFAVSNLAWDDYSIQTVENQVYFPAAGNYTFNIATSRTVSVFFQDSQGPSPIERQVGTAVITTRQTATKSAFVNFNVPAPGIYVVRYVLNNVPPSQASINVLPYTQNNPPAVAITITRPQPAGMSSGTANPTTNVIWSTRFGTEVALTSNTPVFWAPLVYNYFPDRTEYDWSVTANGKQMAFVSTNNNWTDEELARFGLIRDNVHRVTAITNTRNTPAVIIQAYGTIMNIAVGYYVFKRGQSWADARWQWSGNQLGTYGPDSVPMAGVNARGRSISSYQGVGRNQGPTVGSFRRVFESWGNRTNPTTFSEDRPFCTFNLPQPPADEIYILAYADTTWFTQPNNFYNGSANLTFTAFASTAQIYRGGQGGASRTNLSITGSSERQNYFGGWGGQVGTTGGTRVTDYQKFGGGGGGGGATLILLETPGTDITQTVNVNPTEIKLTANWYQRITSSTWFDEVGFPTGLNLSPGPAAWVIESMPGRNPSLTSILFAGNANSFASVPSSPSLNIGGLVGSTPKEFTIEAWVRATGPGSFNPWGGEIINKDNEYEVARRQDGRIAIAVEWGQGNWLSVPGNGWMTTNYTLPLNTTALISVVFTQDQNCLLYVNAELKWTAKRDGFPLNNGNMAYTCWRYNPTPTNLPLYIGNRNQRVQAWQGYIGDVRLWNTARTQAQIAETFNGINYTYTTTTYRPTLSRIAIAGGGGGGGGALVQVAPQDQSQNAFNAWKAPPRPPTYGKYAGSEGGQNLNNAGGGGGGGGALGGAGGTSGFGQTQSKGGYQGAFEQAPGFLSEVNASWIMIGQGGNGGYGGGGAGELRTGIIALNETMTITVGGTTDGDNGISSIDNGTLKYIAGKGGDGGYPGNPWASTAVGQAGGCEVNTNRKISGGSGGGGGPGPYIGGATAVSLNPQTSNKTSDTNRPTTGPQSPVFVNRGSAGGKPNATQLTTGGGGGTGGGGVAPTTPRGSANLAKSGDGGPPRLVELGSTGIRYTLGAGGGGAAPTATPGLAYVGKGGGNIGGWGETGSGGGTEFTRPGVYKFIVPPTVTGVNITATAGGGGGGSSGANPRRGQINRGWAGGGGGAGGYLVSTSFGVTPGREITITVGAGGNSTSNGSDTRIVGAGLDITLRGGRAGTGGSNVVKTPGSTNVGRGGAGGDPNGSPGVNASINEFEWCTGDGGGGLNPGGGGVCVYEYNTSARPSNNGFGTGGGGGFNFTDDKGRPSPVVPGSPGGSGYVQFEFVGFTGSIPPVDNTGSGGGGGFNQLGSLGAAGFVAIAYPGARVLTGGDRVYSARGFTIHEFTKNGTLQFAGTVNEGSADTGVGSTPGGQDVFGYQPGVAVGGRRQQVASIVPVTDQAYDPFLNQYGVWNNEVGALRLQRFYTWYAPATGRYVIRAAANSGGYVWFDNGIVFDMTPINRGNGLYYAKNVQTTEKKFTANQAVLIQWDIYASAAPGAFAMTIALADSPNIVIFDSRDPPMPEGGPNGGDGLVILELTGRAPENSATVKIDDEYKPINSVHVKVDNVWKQVQYASTKVNGKWRTVYGFAPPIVPEILFSDTGSWTQPRTPQPPPSGGGGGGAPVFIVIGDDNPTTGPNIPQPPVSPSPPNNPIFIEKGRAEERYAPPPPPPPPPPSPPPSPPSGGGGGCKVICQKLAELGYFDSAMNKADQAFGVLLRDNDPDAYNGYLRWAGPVVDLLEGGGSATFRKIVFPWIRDEKARQDLQIRIVAYYLDGIARPWAEEMAYRMNAEGYTKSNPAGKFIMDVGLPMCRLISKFNTGRRMPMWAKTALIWGTTTLLLGIVTSISATDKVIRKIGNFFKINKG